MKNKSLAELSTEELLQKQKTMKVIIGALLGMMIVLIAMAIFLFIQTRKTSIAIPLFVVAISQLPISILNRKSLAQIDAEIVSRKL